MQGEHPTPGPHRTSDIVARERGALRLWEKYAGGQLDIAEAQQIAGVRHRPTLDGEGEERIYKANPHDD